jgi:succinate-semialdehyde dehydrogenase/glutarate-semialdehyde dehydrogenase
MVLSTINPATNKIIKEYPEMSHDNIKDIIEKSHKAFFRWKNVNFSHRAEIMKKTARILQEDAPDEIAQALRQAFPP